MSLKLPTFNAETSITAFDGRIFIAHPGHELFTIRTDPEVGVIVERCRFEEVPAEEAPVFYVDDLMERRR